ARPFVLVAIGVLSRANAPFQVDERALVKVFLCDLRQFSPQHDSVPLGVFLPFPGAILECLIRGHAEIRHRLARGREPYVRIPPQPPHQNHFIHRHGNSPLRRTLSRPLPSRHQRALRSGFIAQEGHFLTASPSPIHATSHSHAAPHPFPDASAPLPAARGSPPPAAPCPGAPSPSSIAPAPA